ncbi:MAG: hypothetical protein FD167_139 [bacterium]|nr:MAG: hypothetical protein FD167_139 [bacterium]
MLFSGRIKIFMVVCLLFLSVCFIQPSSTTETKAAPPPSQGGWYTYYDNAAHTNQVGSRFIHPCTGRSIYAQGQITVFFDRDPEYCCGGQIC